MWIELYQLSTKLGQVNEYGAGKIDSFYTDKEYEIWNYGSGGLNGRVYTYRTNQNNSD